MENENVRVTLLLEMISFALVDGNLHANEYLFLSMIADELGFDLDSFKELFHREDFPVVIKSEFERIKQFYRLALLMHSDAILHVKEQTKIREIGITMGLNPNGIERVLHTMENSPSKMVTPEFLLGAFQIQTN